MIASFATSICPIEITVWVRGKSRLHQRQGDRDRQDSLRHVGFRPVFQDASNVFRSPLNIVQRPRKLPM